MTLEALHEDIYKRLMEHNPLEALLSGAKIYDFDPDEEPPGPYIVIGDTHEVEGRTIDGLERKVFIRLHIWSSYRGRREVIKIEREIEEALSGDIYLFESFQVFMDESGWMHGETVFRTYIERERVNEISVEE